VTHQPTPNPHPVLDLPARALALFASDLHDYKSDAIGKKNCKNPFSKPKQLAVKKTRFKKR
jgi:hypothetical protein